MKFPSPLRKGRWIRRYKRFFVDMEFQGKTIVAHCPNTGSMAGLKERGQLCLFSTHTNPHRKLKYTLEMVRTPSSWVGVNTQWPNKLVRELFEKQTLKDWKKWDQVQCEVSVSPQSRMDLAFWKSKDHKKDLDKNHKLKRWKAKNLHPPLHLVEVKNVTLSQGETALFPDAVTTRGQKHLEEMVKLMDRGFTCEMVYVVQRQDCTEFATADSIDPFYGQKLQEAVSKGLKVTPLTCQLSPQHIQLTPFQLPFIGGIPY